ncbi:MAG: cyclic nucleotide-binding domain-containing protein [Devosia sp.]
MTTLSELAAAQSERTLVPDEILVAQGSPGEEFYVLESGRLIVERDGVDIATLTQANALIGEMSVLLGRTHSATVRADGYARVRVIPDARNHLLGDAAMTLELAALLAGRLDKTMEMLVEISTEYQGKGEHSVLRRILSALQRPAHIGASEPDADASPWNLITR